MQTRSQSQLMTNHVPGNVLPAQRRVRAAYSTTHSPLLFSLDAEQRFWLTRPDGASTTGWARLDLTHHLTKLPELGEQAAVRSFNVSQDADGRLRMIVAAVAPPGGDTHVYVSAPLANSETAEDWAALPDKLTRHAVLPGLDVVDVVMGNAPGETPFAVVAGTDATGQVRYHQINPDPAGDWKSMPLPLPQNATAVLGVAVGRHPKYGRGVYSLLQLGELRSLLFTTLPTKFDGRTFFNTVELDLPAGLNPRTLATLADENGDTALYVGGDGVHHFSVRAQATSHLPGDPLVSATTVQGVRELVVAADQTGTHLGVWALDGRDALVHVAGTQTQPDSYQWQPAAVIDSEVSALSAYLTKPAEDGTAGATMAVGGSDGTFRLVVRQPRTALWQPQTVSLHTTSQALPLQSYTTRLVVTDDRDSPAASAKVTIEPERDCAALVNGRYYALRAGTAKPATTDQFGVLTVVLETADLTVPALTFQVGEDAPVRVDPAADAKAALRGVTSGEQIATAVRSDDKPLFAKPPDKATCDAAATAVSHLMVAHDDLVARAAGQPGRTGAPTLDLVRDAAGNWQAPPAGSLLRAADADDWLHVAVGDLIAAVTTGVDAMKSLTVELAGDAWHLLVRFGKWALRCVLDAAHHAVAAIDWVLEHTLGISLEEIIAWLGFAFNWDDILANHRVVTKLVTLSFDEAIRRMTGFKTVIDERLGEVRDQLVDGHLVVDHSSDIFATRMGPDVGAGLPGDRTAAGESPQVGWAEHQFATNLDATTFDLFVPPAFGRVLVGLTTTEIEVMLQTADQLKKLAGDVAAGKPLSDLLTELFEIVGLAVIDTAEDIAVTAVDLGIQMLAVIRDMMNGRWDVPVLTALYEQVICKGDGSKLSLLDLAALLATIPATVLGKRALDRNLFTEAQVKAIDNAHDWDTAMRALSVAAPKALLTAQDAEPTSDQEAQALQLISGVLRVVSSRFAFIKDMYEVISEQPVPAVSARIGQPKMVCDWLVYTIGLASASLLQPEQGSHRQNIDLAVAIAGFVPIALDAARQVRSALAGRPAGTGIDIELDGPTDGQPLPGPKPDPTIMEQIGFDDVTRYVESAYGQVMLILSFASTELQFKEAPKAKLSQAQADTLLAVKAVQNIMAAFSSMLAVGLATPFRQDPEFGPAMVAARDVVLMDRAALQFGRSLAQLALGVVDMEGIVP